MPAKQLKGILRGLRYLFRTGMRIEPFGDGSLLMEIYHLYIDSYYERPSRLPENDYVPIDCSIPAKNLRSDSALVRSRLYYIAANCEKQKADDKYFVPLLKETATEDGHISLSIHMPTIDRLIAHRNADANRLILPGIGVALCSTLFGVFIGSFLKLLS